MIMKRDVNGLKGSIEYMNQVAEQAAFPKLREQLIAESLVRRCQEIESDLETALDQKNLMMIDKAIQNAVALKYDCPILHEARRERKNLQHLATGILTNIGESCRAHDTKELTRCQAQAKSLGFTSPRLSQLDVLMRSLTQRLKAEVDLRSLNDFNILIHEDHVSAVETAQILPIIISLDQQDLSFDKNADQKIRYAKKYLQRRGRRDSHTAEDRLLEVLASRNIDRLEEFVLENNSCPEEEIFFAVSTPDQCEYWVATIEAAATDEDFFITKLQVEVQRCFKLKPAIAGVVTLAGDRLLFESTVADQPMTDSLSLVGARVRPLRQEEIAELEELQDENNFSCI